MASAGPGVLPEGWALPGGAVVKGAVELPFELRGARLSLAFVPDAEVGARLERIVHRGPRGAMTFHNGIRGPVVGGPPSGLWEVRATVRGGATVRIGPEDAEEAVRAYETRGVDGTPGLLLVWGGIGVSGAPEADRLRVAVLVTLAAEDLVSRWYACVAREHGESASVDELDLPILTIRGPIAPRPGESHLDAQKRARRLVPSGSLTNPSPFFTNNASAWLWMVTGLDRRHVHPNPDQSLQFSVVYAADPRDPASYRRMLYLGTEDTTGHYKVFRRRGLVVLEPGGEPAGYLGWRATFVPTFEDVLGTPRTPTEFGNTYATPYPAVVGVLEAATDAFWYDAAAFYREFVERHGLGGLRPREDPRYRSSFVGRSLFVAFAQLAPEPWKGAEFYRRQLELARAWRAALADPQAPPTPTFLHMQTYALGSVFRGTVSHPVETNADEGVVRMVEAARDDGIACSVYTYPSGLARDLLERPPRPRRYEVLVALAPYGLGWERFLRPGMLRYRRDGSPDVVDVGVPGFDAVELDLAAPAGLEPIGERADREIARVLGLEGLYSDVIGGSGPQLAYDPPAPEVPSHPAHGGDAWTRGKVRLLGRVRESVASVLRERAGPGGETRPFLLTEVTEEFVAAHVEWFQDGYVWLPGHLLLAEDRLLGLEGFEAPEAARDLSPPVWNAVYHEWAPGQRFAIPLSSVGLETNPRFHPTATHPGTTADELVDLQCFVFAAAFVAGYGASLHYFPDVDASLVELRGGEPWFDREIDPQRAGPRIVSFVRRLFAARRDGVAGDLVGSGRMERPLEVAFSKPGVDLAPNPVRACRKTDPRYARAVYPFAYEQGAGLPDDQPGWQWGTADFEVPRVLHSVWRSPQGRLGLVLAAWSGVEAAWEGRFDPGLYGFAEGEQLVVRERLQDGASRVLGELAGAGAVAARAHVRTPGTLAIGPMPPRSVRVLTFERARRA